MNLRRGEIYYIKFPYTLDEKYPNGKPKFVLILQEGEYFRKFQTVEILLITSDKQYKAHEKYVTDVVIEQGTTRLKEKSWVLCAQPYPLEKVLFEQEGVWCAGRLSAEKMDEIDEALFFGLCIGLQSKVDNEPAADE